MSASDQRRRIVHYVHDFATATDSGRCNLVMHASYIYYSLSLPKREIYRQKDRILDAFSGGDWRLQRNVNGERAWSLDGLRVSFQEFSSHPEDARANRILPAHYSSIDVTIRTNQQPDVDIRLPWDVLSKGMRIPDRGERPREVPDLSLLSKLHPFHIEIGCGLSVEAGIPALHHLHELYRVTDLDSGRFIFGDDSDDLIPRLAERPLVELPRLGSLFQSAFESEPTRAHRALHALQKAGYLLTPVFTNNFDGLTHRVGLTERFLRRYDETVPHVDFSPAAKALLVVGSHADRRRVQARARQRGLQVVFLDTEGYTVGSRFIAYPLEGPRSADILCRKSATEGLTELCAMLGLAI